MSHDDDEPRSLDRMGPPVIYRAGDYRLPPDSRQRWGNVLTLTNGAPSTGRRHSAMFVSTPTFEENRQWKLEARFWNPDGGFWQTTYPATVPGSITIKVDRAIDRDKGAVSEDFVVASGLPWIAPVVTAIQLNVTAQMDAGAPASVEVEICAVPTLCCDDGPGGIPAGVANGYSVAPTSRFPTDAAGAAAYITPASIVVMAGLATRAQFFFQNRSAVDLAIRFGAGADLDPGSEFATMVLPGDISAIYESPANGECYKGPVSISISAADPTGYILVTQGVFT